MAEAADSISRPAADCSKDDTRVSLKSVEEVECRVSRPAVVHNATYSSVSLDHGYVHSSGIVMYGNVDSSGTLTQGNTDASGTAYGSVDSSGTPMYRNTDGPGTMMYRNSDSSETMMWESSDSVGNESNDLSGIEVDENIDPSETDALEYTCTKSPGRMVQRRTGLSEMVMHTSANSSAEAMVSSGTEMFLNSEQSGIPVCGTVTGGNSDSLTKTMCESTDSSKAEAVSNSDPSVTMLYSPVRHLEAVTSQGGDDSAAALDRIPDSFETEMHENTRDELQDARHDNDASDRLSDELLEKWMKAAQCGDLDTLEAFLTNGFVTVDARYHQTQPHSMIPEGETALLYACRYGQIEAAKLLLRKGADITIRAGDEIQDTVLHRVVRTGGRFFTFQGNFGQELAAILLKYGADPHATCADGKTPLMLAAKYLLPSTVQLLINAGSDVNHRDHAGLTALHLCFTVRSGPSFMMEISIRCAISLINAGANMDIVCSQLQTPLVWAIKHKNVRGARFLIMQNCDPDLPNSIFQNQPEAVHAGDVDSPFRACLRVKDLKTLMFLLRAGCRYENWSDVDGLTDFRAEVRELLSQPRCLMKACRVVIRRSLRSNGGVGPKLMEKVEQLSIPSSLKDFISVLGM